MNKVTWLEKAVFYNIYPQSFYDTNGDGIPEGSGTKRGIPSYEEGEGGGSAQMLDLLAADLMDVTASGDTDPFAQALGQYVFAVHVEKLVLQGRASGVYNEYKHVFILPSPLTLLAKQLKRV